ncbi:MAG: PepSY domain-containing protein [Eubacterium sp.]|nr:PepSY domain-containing protein [Eubacterium sp.]
MKIFIKIKKAISIAAVCTIAAFVLSANADAAPSAKEKYIGNSKAKSIALKHAGLSLEEATFIKTYKDYDDGQVVYDVEFYSGSTEYDYEIDAVTGDILEYDREIEYYTIPNKSVGKNNADISNTEKYITKDKAKSIALKHAGLSSAETTFIKAHKDHDDGRVVYEVEFYSGSTEYDYEIDAVTEDILEYDREIEYYSIPGKNGENSPGQPAKKRVSGDTVQYIGKIKAKNIALADAGQDESKVSKIKVELDREAGKMVYEIEFKIGRTEYEYEIDAKTGEILKSDIEYDD